LQSGELQPNWLPAGFKGVPKGFLENLIMNVFWIPIVAIAFSLGLAMLGLWTDHQRRTQKLEHLHRERMAAIEKGIALPQNPDADRPVEKKSNPARVLRSGVLLLSLGVVLCLAIDAAGGREGALFGLIPATLGLANLAYAVALFRKEREAAGEKVRSFLPPP
jgi:Domain of unknown function (DUF6249)